MQLVKPEYQDEPIDLPKCESKVIDVHDPNSTIHRVKRYRLSSVPVAIPPGVPVTWNSYILPNGKLISTYSVAGGEPITQEGFNFVTEAATPQNPRKELSDSKSEDTEVK